MTYQRFLSEHPELVERVKSGTLRQWRNRDNVPDSAVTKLLGVTKPPAKGVTKQEGVTKSEGPGEVVTPSADGNPAFDIMADGYARGFDGDSKVMRANYRTPHALRRQAEAKGLEEKDIRKFIAKAGYPVLAMGTEVKEHSHGSGRESKRL